MFSIGTLTGNTIVKHIKEIAVQIRPASGDGASGDSASGDGASES